LFYSSDPLGDDLSLIWIRPRHKPFKETVEYSLSNSLPVDLDGTFARAENRAIFSVTHTITFHAKKAQERHELMFNRCLLPLLALEDSMILDEVNNQPKRRASHAILIFKLGVVEPTS
jgi:hypothetical protein